MRPHHVPRVVIAAVAGVALIGRGHESTIVHVRPGVLEDQLASTLVTKDNVNDPSLWGNTLK